MRIRTLVLSCLLVIFLYGLIKYPRSTAYPFRVGMSMVQYPFLCIYSLTLQPLFDTYKQFKNHREYQALIVRNHSERSLLLQELIEAQAALVRCKDMQALGIPYERASDLYACGVAQIIYKQLQADEAFFIIDKGSRDGMCVDMLATLNNVLLGRVVSVYPWYAQVMPITASECHVPVVCAQSHANGVFHANQLDFVSHLEPLMIDELVLTSGDGLIYPQGLAIGRIKKFTINDLGFLYQVVVEPLHDLSCLKYCSIISKNTQQALRKNI